MPSSAAYVDVQHAEPVGAEDKANPGEDDRAADPRPLDPAGDRAEERRNPASIAAFWYI
jgi:hypothetical protein